MWPAFVDAHREMFIGEDIERGELTDKVRDALVIESLERSMDDVVDVCCEALRGSEIAH